MPTKPTKTYHPPIAISMTEPRFAYCTLAVMRSSTTAIGVCKDIPKVAVVGPAAVFASFSTGSVFRCSHPR